MAEADFQGTILDATGYADFGAPGLAPAARVNGHEMLQRYTGKDYDPITELYYFNARWQNPELGRFITEDPIRDGVNWFIFCNNSPMVFTDPSGLDTRLLTDTTGAFGAGHTALMSAVYNEDGAVVGYNIYEVGPRKDLVVPFQARKKHDEGVTQEVLSDSGINGSIVVVLEYYPIDSDELTERLERYNLVTTFNTTPNEDLAINQEAETAGVGFGQYNLFTNMCADHAIGSLAPVGIEPSSRTVDPWNAHLRLVEENPDRVSDHSFTLKPLLGGGPTINNPMNQAAAIQ